MRNEKSSDAYPSSGLTSTLEIAFCDWPGLRTLLERRVNAGARERLPYFIPSEAVGHEHVCALLDGRLLGLVGFCASPTQERETWVVYVGVDARARGRGLARAMIEALFARAASEGRVLVPSSFTPDGAPLKRVFERLYARHPATRPERPMRDF